MIRNAARAKGQNVSGNDAFGLSDASCRALLANVADMVTVSDRDGNVVYASPATESVSGYTPDEFMARGAFDSIHPEDRPRCREALEKLVANPGLSLELEHRVRHKNGDVRWVEGTFTSLFDDPDVGGLVATVRDITERKRADDALRESEEHLQQAVSIDTVGVLFFSLDGRMTDTNEAFARMAGYDRDELLDAVSWEALMAPEFETVVERAVEELATRGETAPYEKQLVRKDGSRWWGLCAPRRLSGSGRESECVEFVLDITERKRLEAERERLKIRETAMRAETVERERISRELHDRVAHSMGVVYQSLQLYRALAENAPERAGEKLVVAEETARIALDQTRNLAIELRRSVAEETQDGLTSALWMLLDASAPHGVEVGLSSSGDESLVPPDVGAQVYLVMREAIRNALKHSECEQLGAGLEIEPDELLATVTDDGKGFDPEADPLLGHRAGMGLGSMRERAEMVGGRLTITSNPDEGTTVEVRVPLGGRDDTPVATGPSTPLPPRSPGRPPRADPP